MRKKNTVYFNSPKETNIVVEYHSIGQSSNRRPILFISPCQRLWIGPLASPWVENNEISTRFVNWQQREGSPIRYTSLKYIVLWKYPVAENRISVSFKRYNIYKAKRAELQFKSTMLLSCTFQFCFKFTHLFCRSPTSQKINLCTILFTAQTGSQF